MDDRNSSRNRSPTPDGGGGGKGGDGVAAEPTVRSRWTPKPEQILILESIFNSGTVNPPKDETVRIRKLLEKFGSVGDANVFYWFQNRRSRSRRRQRQLQAAGLPADPRTALGAARRCGGAAAAALQYEPTSSSSSSSTSSTNSSGGGCGFFNPCSSSASSSGFPAAEEGGVDDLLSLSHHMGFVEGGAQNPFLCVADVAPMNYQPGTISVFINGIPCEVPKGPVDMRTMFGQNATLVHSSGELLPVNEYGVLLQSLRMGESYFLVSSST